MNRVRDNQFMYEIRVGSTNLTTTLFKNKIENLSFKVGINRRCVMVPRINRYVRKHKLYYDITAHSPIICIYS